MGVRFSVGPIKVSDFDLGHCIGVAVGKRAFRFRLPFGLTVSASARAWARRNKASKENR